MSQRSSSTDAGDINRRTEEEKGRKNSGTGAEFGQNIGRSENLEEGGDMENRNKGSMGNMENEESRRPSGDKGFGSSSGRSSGSSDMDSNIERGDLNENEGSRSNRSDSVEREGRH
ncbi:MAG TPA: hypothetical protein VKB93_20465 [Thermoanaerobaculia bacterium]|nr:hypothetical protein [Thermoanaerobaculia bacterium]